MSALDLARWQFAITTIYHFFFVPVTIGLSLLVAGMQTAWYRTNNDTYLRMTKFWGKLLLINFALGVATGIVQEFQFGMNWSAYSRFVGDIFGAPLAMEALLAFFLESTFLGLWIFGWDKLPKKIHLATIWAASIGTMLSAYFILAANSWMQHPVGYVVNTRTDRAELKSIWKVLTNSTALVTFPHTITAAFVTAGALILSISAWHLFRKSETAVFGTSLKLGLVTVLVATVGVAVTGDLQARIMTEQQPMKMAAAEALWDTSSPASFSLFTVGSLDGTHNVFSIRVPHLLSFLAAGNPDGTVEGINQIQARYTVKYGPGDYKPNVPVAYWSFRLMIGLGALLGALALLMLWLRRRGRDLPGGRIFRYLVLSAFAMPLLANSFGWLFTEMGRQPWTVFGVLQTPSSVSPTVSGWEVATSVVVFTLLYALLAVVEVKLILRYMKEVPPARDESEAVPDREPAFSY
ncbi:MAG TPA: cytochrome ubiquinol oxidase subunit I [Actinomycetes bacterium]